MFSSRKIFLIEDWFDYAMVTANLKCKKKKNEKKQPCIEIEVPLKRKKNTDTLKKQNKTQLTKKKTKKTKQT